MKLVKKFLAVTLALLMLVAYVPAVSAATETGVTETGFKYQVTDGILSVTGYEGEETHLVIPDEIAGVTVTRIGSNAFEKNTAIESVIIPDSVTIIEAMAFNMCTSLKNVDLSANLETLGHRAFANTAIESVEIPKSLEDADTYITNESYDFNGVSYSIPRGPFMRCENLKTVTFEKGVTQITGELFAGCVGLESIVIPDTVTVIEDSAFYSCVRLSNVDIPDTVTHIGAGAFTSCASLKNIELSKSLKTMGQRAFAYSALESIEIPRSFDAADTYITNENYELGGVNYSIPRGPFLRCENLKTVTFQKGVTQIASELFAGCTGLEKVEIPDTVTVIEGSAFSGCVRLSDVTIPDTVTVIDAYAFNVCPSLKSVDLSDNLTKMGTQAFAQTGLESIEIPKSLVSADTYITNTGYNFDGVDYSLARGPFLYCANLKTATFEEGTTAVANNVFAGCVGLEKVEIPETVTAINNGAFQGCVRLQSVEIPEVVTFIGNEAFSACASLTDVTVPKNVEKVGENAFAYCRGLESIEFKGADTELWDGVLRNCVSLTDVKLPAKLDCLSKSLFLDSTALKTVEIPETVTRIYNNVFSGCTALCDVTIPENLEEIGASAFYGCTALTKINIPQSVKKLGDSAFMGCEYLTDVDFADYSVTVINKSTFKDCFELAKIQLPKGLLEIKAEAFMNDYSLTEVVIPESVTNIDSSAFSYPSKTTVYSQTDSYVEEFATNGGFKFVDNVTEAKSLTLSDGISSDITLELGEKLRVAFDSTPGNANEVVTLTADNKNVIIAGHDLKADRTGVTVITAKTASGATYSFNINLRKVDEIKIVAEPEKKVYHVGEELDLTGLLVQSEYSDDTVKEVTDYTVTGFDNTKAGKTLVTVSYKALNGATYTKTFEVEVVDAAKGDVNQDGDINIKDATAIQKHLAKLEILEGASLAAADYDEDSVVTIKDATAIQKRIAGLE